MFAFQDRRGAVEVAFTDRHAGAGPHFGADRDDGDEGAELDLLARDPADFPAVRDRLARVARAWAGERGGTAGPTPDIALMRQVHGARVVVVEDGRGEPPEADALVTAAPGTILAARAADCVPVLLADPDRRLVAAVHAGRAGVLAGVVPAAVSVLRGLGAEDLVAWIGPHACGRCYEVPERMRAEVAAAVPATWSQTSWGTPALDLGAGVQAQLREVDADVVRVARCTIEDADLFSYRRDGSRSGRHAGLVRVRP